MVLKALVTCAAVTPKLAFSQVFPSRPIRVIIPFSAGGGALDTVVRPIAQEWIKTFGQPVLIENKPGAGSVIGVNAVAKSAPDGYTLVCVANSFAVNHTLVPKLPYDTLKDLRPIGLMARTPNVLAGNPGVPAQDLRELVAYAKSNPGKLSIASPGNGTVQHLGGQIGPQSTIGTSGDNFAAPQNPRGWSFHTAWTLSGHLRPLSARRYWRSA